MLAILWAGITLSACTDWMYDDRSGCEHGVCLSFKYDYNLQRADMIGHVGSVGVFVYDEEGRFVTSYIEPNLRRTQPCLYLDLPQGNYQFLAVAQQRSFDELQAGPGANFTWSAPDAGDGIDDFSVSLAHQDLGNGFATVLMVTCRWTRFGTPSAQRLFTSLPKAMLTIHFRWCATPSRYPYPCVR